MTMKPDLMFSLLLELNWIDCYLTAQSNGSHAAFADRRRKQIKLDLSSI
jgi:hypothetical protein